MSPLFSTLSANNEPRGLEQIPENVQTEVSRCLLLYCFNLTNNENHALFSPALCLYFVFDIIIFPPLGPARTVETFIIVSLTRGATLFGNTRSVWLIFTLATGWRFSRPHGVSYAHGVV